MTIKEARAITGISQVVCCSALGIPVRTLQNWEYGARECPKYVEQAVVENILKLSRKAIIRFEKDFKQVGLDISAIGYSVWVSSDDTKNHIPQFVNFYPANDGRVSIELVSYITALVSNGYDIKYE